MTIDFEILSIMNNRLDYKEYCSLKKDPCSAMDYAQRIGMIEVSRLLYPELNALEAYMKFIQMPIQIGEKKSCCKGGAVK